MLKNEVGGVTTSFFTITPRKEELVTWIIIAYLAIGLILESIYIYKNRRKPAPDTLRVTIFMLLWYVLEIILWPLYLLRGILIRIYLPFL